MPDDPYSLSDLARLADVTPRTVRYYVALGLLPSPEAAGPATRYGEGHLARLRLIRRLQRDHLPLAEIRIRLERLADDEIMAAVSALDAREPDPSQDPGDTLAFVRSLMQQAGIRPTVVERSPAPGVSVHRVAMAESLDEAWAEAAAVPPPAAAAPPGAAVVPPQFRRASSAPVAPISSAEPAPASSPRPGPDRTTWERLVISPDVELHVRRPLDRTTNKRVDQLERIARELFEDH
jgi:DNA-binding transcriptional MerR regulator